MRFEQAPQAMREGKKIMKKDLPSYKYGIFDGKVWQEYPDFNGDIIYVPNIAFACRDILSADLEIVDE